MEQTFLALMIATGLPVALFVLFTMGLIQLIVDRVHWPRVRHQRLRENAGDVAIRNV